MEKWNFGKNGVFNVKGVILKELLKHRRKSKAI